MKIFVNDEEVIVHKGARVLDVIRVYHTQNNEKIQKKRFVITDAFGNSVASDGELSEGNHLYIKTKTNKTMKLIVKKIRKIFGVILIVSGLLIGCKTNPKVVEQSKIKTVEILAVNDIHAAVNSFPRLAFMADSLRAIYPDLLLISAGDNQTGNPVNDQYPQKGMPVIELMNAVGFNLSAVGNHEFDSRLAGFEYITHQAKFIFLNANMKMPIGANFKIKPYKIIESPNGLKIAFVSFLNINENGIPDSHPDNVKGFVFENPYEKAQEYLFLKDSADFFIMVNHMGFEEDVKLANLLPAESVDVIIGGHSHTKVEKDQIHNGIMITQAERKLKYATLIKLSLSPDGKVSREMQLLTVGGEGNLRADIQEMVDVFNNNPAMTETIAIAEDNFSNYEEIGYLMTDALRGAAKTDIAFINPGGVRISELAKGPVLTKDVYEMDPFGNEMVLYKLTGHEMRNLFLAAFKFDDNLPIYPSGLSTRYMLNSDETLKDVKLFAEDGAPFDMDKLYSVVMNDYMASIYRYEHNDIGQGLFRPTAESMIEYLRELKNIPSYKGVKRVELIKR